MKTNSRMKFFINYTMVCSSSLIVLLFSTNIIVVVQAHEEYKWEVPNGDQEIYGSYALGHTDPEGCSQINWFGMDFGQFPLHQEYCLHQNLIFLGRYIRCHFHRKCKYQFHHYLKFRHYQNHCFVDLNSWIS